MSSSGHVPPSYAALRAELVERLRGRVDADLDTSDGALAGQLISLLALRLAQGHEAVADLADARDPDNSTGASLETHAALAGVTRAAGETDGALRRRREDRLAAPMATSADELWKALTAIDGVFDAAVVAGASSYQVTLYTIFDDAVADPGDDIAAALLEHLAAGTELLDPGSATSVSATDSQGVFQSFLIQNLEGSGGEITAMLDITVIVPSTDDVTEAEVAAAALPPDVADYPEDPPADAALVLNTGARNTRFGYPITRSDVTRRIFAALPQVLDVAVLTTALALDVDVPLSAYEAALWDVSNFTVSVVAA